MEKLVSIITPCYNTGKYIGRLLNSVLSQTYPRIEMFVIDDGSIDNSKDIVSEYIQKFSDRGYKLNYVYQENQGQSVAINNGLKLVNGEFLAWPDSDDFYSKDDAIEQMVTRLESSSQEVALVRCKMQILDEETLQVIGSRGDNCSEEEPWELFEDCLMGNFYFYPGCYMVRFSIFKEANGLDIYTEKDAGQNWQMFLPVLYLYRCTTINDYLFSVIARKTSHSRGQYQGVERTIQKWEAYERTILATIDKIKSMPALKKRLYKERIIIQYALRKFKFAADNSSFSNLKKFRKVLIEHNAYSYKLKIRYYCAIIPGSKRVYNCCIPFIVKMHHRIKSKLLNRTNVKESN